MNPEIQTESLDTASPSGAGSHHRTAFPAILGIGSGALITAIGICIWVIAGQEYQMTWMAAVIALGASFSIRVIAKADHYQFGFFGAFYALVASLAGNLFTAVYIVSQRGGKSTLEIFRHLDIPTAFSWLSALTRPIDLFMYTATVFIGFWFSFSHSNKKTS